MAEAEEGFWRVYAPEWTVAHVSDADGEGGRAECEEVYRSRYNGQVPEGDWRAEPWSAGHPGEWPWTLEIRLPVMKGEFRLREDAEAVAAGMGGVVECEGSEAELAMRHQVRDLVTRKGSG